MIFVGNTEAAKTIANAKVGDRFRILGIPRINPNALLARGKKNGFEQL
jgi:hypothetical protein